MTQKLLLASTSSVYGKPYLSYLMDELVEHFNDTNEILFIPYARPGGISYDEYTDKVKFTFNKINKKIVGIHEFQKPKEALEQAQAYFVGGGNSFVLLNTLYYNRVLDDLKENIKLGKPYLGTSAGINIAGKTIMNTNDMPIILPPSFKAMGLIPFNINPHYIDPNPDSTHMGETRETRIREYLTFNSIPVIGLREGSWLQVKDSIVTLKGELSARFFEKGKDPIEIPAHNIIHPVKY